MLDKLRFVIGVFIVPKMLLESYTKRAASLSDVFHVTIRASKLIDSTIVECLLIRILSGGKWFADGVSCGKCDFDRRIFEKFSDELGLFVCICKLCPFCCLVFFFGSV
jgi:hypothetical protein